MKSFKITNIFFLFLILFKAQSQEIIATVRVDASDLQNLEKSIFTDMEQNIKQFLNNRKWTNDKFSVGEKIKMNVLIKILSQDGIGKYKGSVQIQSSRPVYNSSYETILINHLDKDCNFEYVQYQTIDFNDNTFISHLSSILAFYTYIALALDYDSFSKFGGSTFLEKAQLVLNNAQQQGQSAWENGGGSNSRYWLFENLNSPQFKDFREANYIYHRLGFDSMQKNTKEPTLEESYKKMLDALDLIKKCFDVRPNSALIRTYFNTKDKEFVSIFSEAGTREKIRIYELLKVMDPTNLDNYEKLK